MNFKKYLNESPVFGFTNYDELINSVMIPLSEPLMKRLGYYFEDTVAYHATSLKSLPGLVKSQNTRKHLSCFTQGDYRITSLPSKPEIIVSLKGDEVISGPDDIYSFVDSSKRRWIMIKQDYPKGKKLRFMIKGIVDSIKQEINPENKRKFLKAYLIRLEQSLNQNYKMLNDYLQELKKYNKGYNEVILTRWEIQGVYSLKKDTEVQEMCQKLNIPYYGHLDSGDIRNL